MLNVKNPLLRSFIDFISFPINSNVAFYSSLLISLAINSTKMVRKLKVNCKVKAENFNIKCILRKMTYKSEHCIPLVNRFFVKLN